MLGALADRVAATPFGAVYTVRFATAIYLLRPFKQKSKQGIKTPRVDIKLINVRSKDAEADRAATTKQEPTP